MQLIGNNYLFLLSLFLFSLSFSLATSSTTNDHFKENLQVEVLPDGKIISRFSFDIEWKINTQDNYSYHHTNLFPKALATISHDTKAEEIHLSFTQGRWRNAKWGKNSFPAPSGVELRAWFRENNQTRVDVLWKQLVYSLGGVFCASLQYLDRSSSTNPVYSFSPSSSLLNSSFGDVTRGHHRMRYGSLPREAVCTENHTPWIKLLPCRDISGLGNLMNPLRVYDVLYHSMQTHVIQSHSGIVLKLSLSTVVDPKFENWFLTSLFGRPKSSITSCPLASESKVSFLGVDPAVYELSPRSYSTVENSKKAVFDLKASENEKFDVEFKWANKMITSLTPASPILLASRVLTGYGGERGGFKTHITNTVDYDLNITYFETVPWFVRPYYHTLQISINGVSKNILSLPCARIIPPELRDSPSMVELCLTVPAQGKVVLSMEFEKEFLHYTEFPPDAHRGFDLPAAVITTKLPNNDVARFYTENLLLSLPTPDFSMLYNVITLTCTVIALFYGSIFNMSIRRLKNTFTGKDFVSDRPLAKLYRFITSKIFKTSKAPPASS